MRPVDNQASGKVACLKKAGNVVAARAVLSALAADHGAR
jgi:hypothetical protein